MLVVAVPAGVVQRLRHGGAGAEAEGDPEAVLASAGAEGDAHQGCGRTPAGVQVGRLAAVEGLGGAQQGVVEGAQGGRRPVRGGQRAGGGVVADGCGESPGPCGGPRRDGLPGPEQGGGGLGEGQRGRVPRVQPALGGGRGEPAQPGPGEGVLGVVEGGGECGPPGGGLLTAHGIEQGGDGVVHRGDRRPLPVEAEVPGERTGCGQGEPQHEQPAGPGERHPGTEGGADEQLRARGGGDGSDRADTAGEQPEPGERQGQRYGRQPLPGTRAHEQAERAGQRGHPEPPPGGCRAGR